MGLTHRILIRIEADQAAWFEEHHDRRFPHASWVEVQGSGDARELSKLLHATVAEFELQTTVGQIWIHGYVDGGLTRELLFTEGAWQIVSGEAFEFENHSAMSRWLSKKRLFPDDAGESIFEALLGKGFKRSGVVSSSHLRADITPDQFEAEEAETQKRTTVAADRAAPAEPENEWVMYLLAEARHAWAKWLVTSPVELPAWVPCYVEQSPAAVSAAVGCIVVAVSHTKRTNSLSVSVFEGDSFVRMVSWENGTWFTDGSPCEFEDERATARLMASSATPDVKGLSLAFLGKSRHISTQPLSKLALEGLMKRPRGRG